MASCEVQGTPSNDNLAEVPAQAETKTNAINKFETINIGNGIVPQPTKIPAPVRLVSSNTSITCSARKYTSLIKLMDTTKRQDESFSSTSTLVNTVEDSQTLADARALMEVSLTSDDYLIDMQEDSGLQMDCSMLDDESQVMQPACSTPRQHISFDSLEASVSFQELDVAEQQTLRVLQEAVAEMEADVELHNRILEDELKLEQKQQREKHIKELMQVVKYEQIEPPVQILAEIKNPEFMELIQLKLDTMEEPMSSSVRKRKHVRVEQLLEAEHNIEMLQKLLQTDNQLASGDTIALPQGIDELAVSELSAGNAVLDVDRQQSKNKNGLLYSLLHIICGDGIRKLSYPLLLCGMAVGLIYYFRKD